MVVKLRHYEKAKKMGKISHWIWQNSCLFLLRSVKTSRRFFQIFVDFSEKLNFNFLSNPSFQTKWL